MHSDHSVRSYFARKEFLFLKRKYLDILGIIMKKTKPLILMLILLCFFNFSSFKFFAEKKVS
jgi:hypothetical protein